MLKVILSLIMLSLPVSEDLFFGLFGVWGVSAVDHQKDIHEVIETNRFVASTPEELCAKLKMSDYNQDGKVSLEDYNVLYQEVLQVSQNAHKTVQDHQLRLRMDLVSNGGTELTIDEEDLGMMYNFVSNQLSYCKLPE
jgi:hypothetical protein